MQRLGIFGTSGFARETADIAYELGYDPFYIARDVAERDAWSFDGEVILESSLDTMAAGAIFAIGIGDNAVRQKVAQRYGGKLTFPTLIHPKASFGHGQRERVLAAPGVLVCAGVRMTNNIRLGDFGIFNLNATVGHDVDIAAFVNVSPGANISGNVSIGERCWIGTGAMVNQGAGETKLVIGHDTTIGSGSVVVRDCDPQAVYVGIPAKRIK
jgi:sugar O-acyltransferase (sialic acid O-acetyltransferase NeuD family)